jgi:hypothetical protein
LKEGERSSIVNLDLMMREINEGDRVILPTVQFQNKSADLSEDAKKALNELAVVLKDNANILSQLEVHTDARGTANDNLMLSKKRATTITEYLVSRGVSKGDFYVKGYGERKIVNHCTDNVDCAEVQHRKNRRIVFWLRAQIGENEIFNQSLASILGKSQSKFSATAQIAGDGKTVKKDSDSNTKQFFYSFCVVLPHNLHYLYND